ncbi:hypothetical protein B0T18DRAFT_401700 [Schizothecium vesticola]|uniref:Uncharacterized protein n=1 Tax=Schizothecium vesticola TaxID=314040 RepID=A0AA40K9Q8_9PEZI|nr:hypothetical protein B0T18DRAFT_401700 [Schizothecium vesticola]
MRRLMERRVSGCGGCRMRTRESGLPRLSSCRPCHVSARPRSTEAELRERREDFVEETQPGRRWRQRSGGGMDRRLTRCKACFPSQRNDDTWQRQYQRPSRIFVGNSWYCPETNKQK